MANMWAFIFMFFLIAHALVGVLMFAGSPKQPTPSWPRPESWLLDPAGISKDNQRMLAVIIMGIAALALIGGALGVVGTPGVVGIWTWLIVAGAILSTLTLVIYFSPWWLGGIAINIGLMAAILAFKWPTNDALGI